MKTPLTKSNSMSVSSPSLGDWFQRPGVHSVIVSPAISSQYLSSSCTSLSSFPLERWSQQPTSIAGDLTASGSIPEHYLKSIASKHYGTSCRQWAFRKAGQYRLFRLCLAGLYWLSPSHKMFSLDFPHRVWLQCGVPVTQAGQTCPLNQFLSQSSIMMFYEYKIIKFMNGMSLSVSHQWNHREIIHI